MATVYVSPSGSNSYTYAQAQSSSTPWLTLAKCNTDATTGDTIIMMTGTHTNSGNNVGYTLTKSFTIQGEVAPTSVNGVMTWTTIIDAANGQWGIGPATSGDISLTLRNIEFRNYKCSSPGSDYNFGIGAGAGTSQATTIDCQYCKFKTWGIGSTYYSGGVFAGALTNDNAMTWTIKYNIFEDIYDSNNGGASYIIGIRNGSSIANITMMYNTFYLTRTVATEILDNLISSYAAGTNTLTCKNNIFYSAAALPFWKTSGGATAFNTITSTSNDFYNISSPPSGTGNITSDPLFIDAANGNFHLRPSSPALDTGTTT
jgi:hypothetical protein